ncbi:MAG: ATP-binding protein [Phycisphaerales bacterium]
MALASIAQDKVGTLLDAPDLSSAIDILMHAERTCTVVVEYDGLDIVRSVESVRDRLVNVPCVAMLPVEDSGIAEAIVKNGIGAILYPGEFYPPRIERVITLTNVRHRITSAERLVRERFEFAARVISDTIWDWWIHEPHRTYHTPQFDTLLGYEPGELPVSVDSWIENLHPEDAPRVQAAIQRNWETGETYDCEYRLRHKDGSYRHVRAVGDCLRDSAGKPYRMIGIIEDVTDQRAALELQRKREEDLRQTQKLEAVGLFASGVAHDFSNLLAAIRGYVSIARATIAPSTQAAKALEQVEKAAAQATGVARSLLTFAKKSDSHFEPINLASVVKDTTRLLRRMLPAGVHTVIDTRSAASLWVRADAVQIQQVVINLAINARDSIAGSGTIRIAVEPSPQPPTTDVPKSKPAPTHVRLVVSDTGAGIPPDILPRVFEPFFTTKPREDGSGLGLSICHAIARDHGGSIDITSRPGEGTTVFVTLPTIPKPETTTVLTGPRPTACVVLDDPHVRGVLNAMLTSLGHDVPLVSASDARRTMLDPAADIDVVLMDESLVPDTFAAGLADLRARNSKRRFILVADPTENRLPASDPLVSFLVRPFRREDLKSLLEAKLKSEGVTR